jgi:hypothetical protein
MIKISFLVKAFFQENFFFAALPFLRGEKHGMVHAAQIKTFTANTCFEFFLTKNPLRAMMFLPK